MTTMLVRFIACAVLIVTLGGCFATRTFHVSVPAEHLPQPPLIERLPLRIGVAYDSNFRAYRHVAEHEDLVGRVVWNVDLGEASVVMFDQVFAAMFERVVSIQSTADTPPELNGVLEVRVQEVRFDGWTVQSPVPVGVSITYGFTLRTPRGGEEIASWSVTGTGRPGAASTTGWERVRKVSTAALRSAAARFMASFAEPVTIQEWLGRQGINLKPLGGQR